MKDEVFLTDLALKCVERMQALSLKGKKRDDASLHYMVGAMMALHLTENDLQRVVNGLVGAQTYGGYAEVEQQAAMVHVPEATA